MSRAQRLELIKKIEQLNNSHLLVYITGDRPGAAARIAEDAVRPMYEHLRAFSNAPDRKQRIDLFIYSRGGDVSVPWRVISMLREFCQELIALVPYKAHSAATMIALGADKIVMGRKAELSPIDPTLVKATVGESAAPPQEISVEDVSSYISFVRERANLNDQAALATVVSLLANQLTPLTLGSVNRQYSHIRLVAKKLLASRQQKIEEERMTTIIEALTEKMYSHGHAIGRREASELGLPIESSSTELELLLWELYTDYEKMLHLTEPLDFEELLQNQEEQILSGLRLACIESAHRLDVFEHNLHIKRRRQIPNNPQININLNLALPAGVNLQALPHNIQQLLQQLIQQVSQQIPSLVQRELVRQSPIIGIEARSYGGRWHEASE
jgi:hypothetical protein